MKKILAKTSQALKTATIFLSLLAVVTAGALSASRQIVDYQKALESEILVHTSIAVDPLSNEEDSNEMTPSSPSSEQTASQISAQPAVNPVIEVRSRLIKQKISFAAVGQTEQAANHPSLTSCGKVATQLAHRFTLVGSRPSGTS